MPYEILGLSATAAVQLLRQHYVVGCEIKLVRWLAVPAAVAKKRTQGGHGNVKQHDRTRFGCALDRILCHLNISFLLVCYTEYYIRSITSRTSARIHTCHTCDIVRLFLKSVSVSVGDARHFGALL